MSISNIYGPQDLYIRKSNEAIEKGLLFLNTELSKPDADCAKIFSSLLEKFATIRHKIAVESSDPYAEEFGRPRVQSPLKSSFTPLVKRYSEYGVRIRDKTLMKPSLQKAYETKAHKFGHPGCQLRVRLASTKIDPVRITQDVLGLNPTTPSDDPFHENLTLAQTNRPELFQAVQDIALIRLSQSGLMSGVTQKPLDMLNPNDREPPYRFASVALKLKIDDQLIEAMQYFCIYLDAANCEITTAQLTDPRNTYSNVIVRHMDKKYIPIAMNRIAKIFESIVKAPTTDNLHADLAELCYLFSFTMPYDRGSASINEWLQKTLVAHRGLELSENKMMDMEAFVKPYYPHFAKKYSKSVQLKPL